MVCPALIYFFAHTRFNPFLDSPCDRSRCGCSHMVSNHHQKNRGPSLKTQTTWLSKVFTLFCFRPVLARSRRMVQKRSKPGEIFIARRSKTVSGEIYRFTI